MKIQALVENTSQTPGTKEQDGLSIYIETDKHKILFDMGADSLFLENAENLSIDIREIDIAVISHGHYDHGGGLEAFLSASEKAKIYILFPLFRWRTGKCFSFFYLARNRVFWCCLTIRDNIGSH